MTSDTIELVERVRRRLKEHENPCEIAGPAPDKELKDWKVYEVANTDLVEYIIDSPYLDELTGGAWKLDADGMLAIPATPGLGLTLDREAVARYTGGARLLER